jgi:AraC-like DNA-binding protein
MQDFSIQTEKMNEVMELLFRVLNIRIAFFDRNGNKLYGGGREEPCIFCRQHRKDPEFDAKCVNSDLCHLEEAKKKKDVLVYHCHAGLLDGVVPFYDRKGNYLGSVVFGQRADKANPVRGVRSSDPDEMENIGRLLKYLSEYICENELIRKTSAPWTIRFEEYITKHLTENPTLAQTARSIGCSASFLSHNLPREFGMSFKDYIRSQKMERAQQLLLSGLRVSECAEILNFYDAFYFSKEFKKHTGQSPNHWKKSHQQPEE